MSMEYMVLIVDAPDDNDVDGASAEVFMRFTERPDDDFLGRLARENPNKRVYCLSGASSWWSE